ncbi:MAG: hypothetical protein CMQ26_04590 [Gammaproteobacteria bacterium]|nr:hypothetical protein [Gammaproteobacteria bacterium]|tara:strand:+ start:972 stop:1808 length:837 start_codon:yes stop_codon:yes gene_type:complete
MKEPEKTKNLVDKLINEPTVHFFVIAVVVFIVYAISNLNGDDVIELDQREIDARILMQEMVSGQPLTSEQQEFITASYVEEQILVKEAVELGLDNDARIHDMLAQKMRHVLSGDIIQPTPAELESFYSSNSELYRAPATVSVDELILDTRNEIPIEIQTLISEGVNSDEILEMASGSSAPLPNANHLDLSNIFAPEFADAVFQSQGNEWIGPFSSNRGQHFLKIIERSEERIPPMAEIADRVRLDWITQEEEIRLQQEVNKLWDRYEIIINDDGSAQH